MGGEEGSEGDVGRKVRMERSLRASSTRKGGRGLGFDLPLDAIFPRSTRKETNGGREEGRRV